MNSAKRSIYVLLILCFWWQTGNCQSGKEILINMLATSDEYKSLKYHLRLQERKNGEISVQETQVKLYREPFKMYMKQILPEEGLELLYAQGWNDNKALVNPNGFPWINISLDPLGSTMRDGQHHPIFHSGLAYVMAIIRHLLAKYPDNIDEQIVLEGEEEVNGRACYKLILNNPGFQIIDYTMKKGETVDMVADKFWISEYMILELNESYDDFDDGETGDLIKIPNDYASKVLIYIDKERLIPISTAVFDREGLFEQFEYLFIDFNPELLPEDFSEDNEEYGF